MHYTYHNKCNRTVKVFIASNRGFVDYIIINSCSTVTQKEALSLTLTLHIEKVLMFKSIFGVGGWGLGGGMKTSRKKQTSI